MSSWTGFGSACADPVAEASPARGQSSVGSQPRQGPKLGRKRRWRGLPGAPSGAGRGVSPRIPRIGTEFGTWSRLRPADAVRGRRGRGDIVACGSSVFFDGAKIRKILQNSVWF